MDWRILIVEKKKCFSSFILNILHEKDAVPEASIENETFRIGDGSMEM